MPRDAPYALNAESDFLDYLLILVHPGGTPVVRVLGNRIVEARKGDHRHGDLRFSAMWLSVGKNFNNSQTPRLNSPGFEKLARKASNLTGSEFHAGDPLRQMVGSTAKSLRANRLGSPRQLVCHEVPDTPKLLRRGFERCWVRNVDKKCFHSISIECHGVVSGRSYPIVADDDGIAGVERFDQGKRIALDSLDLCRYQVFLW
ncbi:hypothetical protein [Mycobacterium lepromatosis]|uniref:hypothetical protein n=1 Tax=Mycobacterium lepromatosis TaxID=480418 RepID=UPI000B2F225A|nr:hypothetical protein [Mycobacterium lepromatosis]